MKKWLWLLPFLWLAGAATAEILIAHPADKQQTFDNVILLQGNASPAAELKIERTAFPARADGSFACGLVLNPGKNLVLVQRVLPAGRQGGEEIKLRVLRLVTFPDVETSYDEKQHWARGQIVYLASLGIIEGYPDGNFYPANPVTRGEFATWLAKVKQLPVPAPAQDVFFDVPKEHWRAPYVKAATGAGYLAPLSGKLFGLEEPISRTEAADLAVRMEGEGIISRIGPLFKEAPRAEVAAPTYVATGKKPKADVASKLPIYDPERAITRAEAATLISHFAAAQAAIQLLSDFERDYGEDKFCALNISPEVAAFTVEPATVPAGKTVTLKLRATLAPRENFAPIASVKADLTKLGGAPDARLYDDGKHGDERAGDQVYSLNLSYQAAVGGEKILTVMAIDRLGWQGNKDASLLVVE